MARGGRRTHCTEQAGEQGDGEEACDAEDIGVFSEVEVTYEKARIAIQERGEVGKQTIKQVNQGG